MPDVLSRLGIILVDEIRLWRPVRCPLDVLLFVTGNSLWKQGFPSLSSLTCMATSQGAQEMVCGLDEAVLSGQEGAKAVHWRSSAQRKRVRRVSLLPFQSHPSTLPASWARDLGPPAFTGAREEAVVHNQGSTAGSRRSL